LFHKLRSRGCITYIYIGPLRIIASLITVSFNNKLEIIEIPNGFFIRTGL